MMKSVPASKSGAAIHPALFVLALLSFFAFCAVVTFQVIEMKYMNGEFPEATYAETLWSE